MKRLQSVLEKGELDRLRAVKLLRAPMEEGGSEKARGVGNAPGV